MRTPADQLGAENRRQRLQLSLDDAAKPSAKELAAIRRFRNRLLAGSSHPAAGWGAEDWETVRKFLERL